MLTFIHFNCTPSLHTIFHSLIPFTFIFWCSSVQHMCIAIAFPIWQPLYAIALLLASLAPHIHVLFADHSSLTHVHISYRTYYHHHAADDVCWERVSLGRSWRAATRPGCLGWFFLRSCAGAYTYRNLLLSCHSTIHFTPYFNPQAG